MMRLWGSRGCSYVFILDLHALILLIICCNYNYLTLQLSGQISLLGLHVCPWDISASLGIGSQYSPSDWCLLLQAAEPWPDEELMCLWIDTDTGCLHLLSLLFDSELAIADSIECWRHYMLCCKYGLCPDLISDS